MRPRWSGLFRQGMRGQALILTIVLLTSGVILVVPLVSFAVTVVRVQRSNLQQVEASYAVESLMEQILSDVTRGADAIPSTHLTSASDGVTTTPIEVTTSYTPPSVTLNGFTPTVTIIRPPDAFVSSGPILQDPGLADPDLQNLPGGTAYLLRLYNVRAGVMQVNWAYDAPGPARVAIWRGIPLDPATSQPIPPGPITTLPPALPVTESTSGATATSTHTTVISVEQDVYTIIFDNTVDPSNASRATSPFQPSGALGDTWLFVDAFRDYIITISAGTVSLRTLIRQIPGFTEPPSVDQPWSPTRITFIENEVPIFSWGPPSATPTPAP